MKVRICGANKRNAMLAYAISLLELARVEEGEHWTQRRHMMTDAEDYIRRVIEGCDKEVVDRQAKGEVG